MVNKVILVGNLGSDPEVRHLESGVTVANFSLATSESYKDKSGQRVKQTEWHRIELWEGLAKVASQYLKKGDAVYIEGKIKNDTFEKDGQKRTITKIRATALTMLGGKDKAPQAQNQSAPVQSSQGNRPTNSCDDLPF